MRLQLADDIPGTLKAVGALGYQAVELENAGPVTILLEAPSEAGVL